MSRFETIERDFWSRAPFCKQTGVAKLVYVWTRTNPACVMSGIYRPRVAQIALDTSFGVELVEDALLDLQEAGLVQLADDGLLWVCDRVLHLRSRNPGVAKSIARDVAELPAGHAIRAAFLDRYGRDPWLRDELRPLVAETVGEPSPNGSGTVSDFPGAAGNSHTVSGRSSASGSASGDVASSSRIANDVRASNGAGRARTREAMEDEVWGHYVQTFRTDASEPTPTFDEPRRGVVRDALAVRDVATCKRAITGLSLSEHHRGWNEGGVKYTDIRYALRGFAKQGESNEDRIDRMAALAAGKESH